MKVLIVEDEVILLKQLNSLIREALPEAKLLPFDNPGDALAALAKEELDIAFLDIAVGEMNGVDLARRIKARCPQCDIVFCTGYSDYAVQAFDLGASDYLMKPVTKEKLAHALSRLRHTMIRKIPEQGLFIRCFGDFEVFYQGKPVVSFTKRSKELLAYLVDKAGAVCASADISSSLFPNSSDSYLRVVKRDLIKTLSEMGEEDILIAGWGKLGINREKVRCDYYEYLDGTPGAVNQYHGVYMRQYPWAQAAQLRLDP